MKKFSVVIGSAYGDEGKGLITDYLSHQLIEQDKKVCVVRFNGGAQAGHTVTTPDGRRHVFHHFGSGHFAGALTFLTRDFLTNPILFERESKELEYADVLVEGESPVTTPYDMLLNQFQEQQRHRNRHGSCGVGIGETVQRQETGPKFSYIVRDMFNEDACATHSRLDNLILEYYEPRLREVIRDKDLLEAGLVLMHSPVLRAQFVDAQEYFVRHARTESFKSIADRRHLIFEGAQGLLLDQNSKEFPHVTRSNTGMKNVAALLRELDFEFEVDAYYVTRCYSTRHGAGALAHEMPDFASVLGYSIVDETNIEHNFQGVIRYAPLNLDAYGTATQEDSWHILGSDVRPKGMRKFNRVDTVTCVDQVLQAQQCMYVDGEMLYKCTPTEFLRKLYLQFSLFSLGPTRNTINSYPAELVTANQPHMR